MNNSHSRPRRLSRIALIGYVMADGDLVPVDKEVQDAMSEAAIDIASRPLRADYSRPIGETSAPKRDDEPK